MKPYRHIIWDWNGTLFDDSWLCVEIVNSILRRRNKPPITFARYRRLFDFPVEAFYARIGFDFSLETYEDTATEFITQYEKRRMECKLQKETVRVLEAFTSDGISHSVLSAYYQDGLEELISHFDIGRHFSIVLGLNNYHAAGKLDNGRKLIRELDVAVDNICLVGDTVHDFQVASALGVNAVLMSGGHNSRERLESCGARVVDSLAEL